MARLTKEKVIEAINVCNGVISDAAKALDCSRSTMYNYINKYPDVKEAHDDITETTIDAVEQKMLDLIMDDGHPTLIIFYLKTKAKHRGYIERQEVTGKDGEALKLEVVYDDDSDFA